MEKSTVLLNHITEPIPIFLPAACLIKTLSIHLSGKCINCLSTQHLSASLSPLRLNCLLFNSIQTETVYSVTNCTTFNCARNNGAKEVVKGRLLEALKTSRASHLEAANNIALKVLQTMLVKCSAVLNEHYLYEVWITACSRWGHSLFLVPRLPTNMESHYMWMNMSDITG